VARDPAELAVLKTPILGHFGALDRSIPLESVRAFEATLDEQGVAVEIHVYPGADHAFANPSGTRYDAAAAELAWDRTLKFLARHLQPAEAP
jgi:carboxymethylenebutenolidase